nr:MAG TPA: hypothetical protein [Caudoviricetes sp.]
MRSAIPKREAERYPFTQRGRNTWNTWIRRN